MNPSTDWVSAIAILAGGLLLGALFVFFFTRRRSAALLDVDLERKDLEAKRDALVAQLRALPDDAIDERARLESETADVLRRLDQRVAVDATPAAPRASTAMNPTIKGFLWGAGSFAALATLGYFVMQSATPRQEGQEATGAIPLSQQQQQRQQQQPATDPFVQQLEAAVQREPDNLNLRNDLAQAYLERDNLMGVFEQTKYVLDRNPRDGRAMTFNALVRVAMGEVETATQMLRQATTIDPKNLDSWVALAWVYAQSGKMPEAEAAIADAKKISPAESMKLEQVLAQMKTHVAQQQQQQQQPAGQLPPDHPPVGGATSQRGVRVTLELDPAARSRSGVLFVIARNPQGGPPVAVKRVDASTFPITVELTEADSMMGQPFPNTFRLEARLDSDGNATTKPPTDPSAMQDGVGPGAVVTLALK